MWTREEPNEYICFLSSAVRYNIPHSHEETKAWRGFSDLPKVTQQAMGRAGGPAQAALGPESVFYTDRQGSGRSKAPFHSPILGTKTGHFLESICPQGERGPWNRRVWCPQVLVRSMMVNFQG